MELKDNIVKGLEKDYERLLELKQTKNSELVIMKCDKIVKIKP